MKGVPPHFDHPLDAVEFRRPGHREGVELYRAHIVRHAFEPHTHEAFGLGAIESGVERFRYRGADHLAPADSLVLMNPDELHTGRAETDGGWRYRMVYLDVDVVERISGERGWHFGDAVGHDAPRARRVGALLQRLWQADEPLAFDSLLHTLLAEFRSHARVARESPAEGALRFAPVVDYLRAHLDRRLTLDELAAVLAVLGGLLGAWSSSMIGIATPSGRLRRFEGALSDGQLLLMVDVPRSRVQEIESLLQSTHPEAHFEGVEPDVPAFP